MPKLPNPFRWFDGSPEVIRLVIMTYVRYLLSLRSAALLEYADNRRLAQRTVRWSASAQGLVPQR